MENYYQPEIYLIGQKHVENWLAENGYFEIRKEMLQANDYGFFAKGRIENVLIRIRTFLYPQSIFKLSDFEIEILTDKALKMGMVAYAAYLTIDETNALVGEINWERLT